jgi:hypothetical protein
MPTTKFSDASPASFQKLVHGLRQLDRTTLEKLALKINQLVSEKSTSPTHTQEAVLVKKIRAKIPASLKRRQKQLYALLQNNRISVPEKDELVLLNQMLETRNAERILLLGELARLRNVPIQEVVTEFQER